MKLTKDQQQKVDLIRRRFVHREDAYSLQWWNPRTEEGGWKLPRQFDEQGKETEQTMPLTDSVLATHLMGRETVGVYQLDQNDTVKWLCFDFDVRKGVSLTDVQEDVQRTVMQCRQLLRSLHLPSLLEGSTNKGYHLWIFFDTPISANKVKSLGDWIAGQLDYPTHVGIEVFPKQVHRKSFGNLVRIPLGVHAKTKQRCLFLKDDFTPVQDQWHYLRVAPTVTETELDQLLHNHNIELQVVRVVQSSNDLISDKNPKCLVTLLHDGAQLGMQDRSAFQLACYLRDRGVPIELVLTLMLDWNTRNDPPMTEEAVAAKVESAFRDAYSPYPCSVELFDDICSPDCVFYETKMRNRQRRKQHNPSFRR
jgi:hypothetical protein